MASDPINVLLVEDNPADARLLIESLKDARAFDFRVKQVSRLRDALDALAGESSDVIGLDLSLPDSSGLETVERVRAAAPSVPIVLLTGLQDEQLALRAVRLGVQDYLVKGQCEQGLAARALRYAVERRRAEAAVQDSEARLRAVVETAVDAIITIDERGRIDSTNAAAERMFGYRRDEMLGRNVSLLMPVPYRLEHDSYLARYLHTGEARIIGIRREVIGARKDGTTFPLDLSVSEFRVGAKRLFTGILHDASNRRRLEREILEAHANEQRRIGHELHDGLCQQLTAASFAAEILARRLLNEAPQSVPAVQKLSREIDEAITQARTLARGLNPVEIHAGALADALDDLARKVTETFHVRCTFRHDGETGLADNTAETHLFRIVQEAISNAIRHGKAKCVEVRLGAADGSVVLSVEDDGSGLNPDSDLRPSTKSDGIGLHTMAYRAKMIGGLLVVRPGSPGGVTVTCTIPLRRIGGAKTTG